MNEGNSMPRLLAAIHLHVLEARWSVMRAIEHLAYMKSENPSGSAFFIADQIYRRAMDAYRQAERRYEQFMGRRSWLTYY